MTGSGVVTTGLGQTEAPALKELPVWRERDKEPRRSPGVTDTEKASQPLLGV